MATNKAAPSDSEQAAAREPTPNPAPSCLRATLDPQLFMATHRGDSNLLKDLLQLKDDDGEGEQATSVAATEAQVCIDVEVDGPSGAPPGAAAAALASSSPWSLVPVVLDDEDEVTMEGDTLLHVAASCGDHTKFVDCVDVIVRAKKRKGGAAAVRRALEARNPRDDTPLHCAARAGNANMISHLVCHMANNATTDDDEQTAAAVKAFLGRKNKCGETALHQAVRAASKAAIGELLAVDPEMACSREEDAACSPFYLAVSLWGEDGEMDIASYLFDKTSPSIRSNLSYYSGPADGRNVLHAAVSCASVETVILLSQLLMSAASEETPPGLLLSQLASQRDKENGSTPLHLAASLGGLPSSFLLLPPQVWPAAITRIPWVLGTGSWDGHDEAANWRAVRRAARMPFFAWSRYSQTQLLISSLLLYANVAMAYQPDKTGRYPVHVAAGSGSLRVVEMLLERCPDCATLRDANGRTLLHVAAEEGRSRVVKYVCKQSRRDQAGLLSSILNAQDIVVNYVCKQSRRAPAGLLSSILNAQDINGDTALHRAVHAEHLDVVRRLIGNQQVRLDVPNNVGMRPIDVSWTTLPLEAYYAWDPRVVIRRSLLRVGAPYGENNRGDLFREKCRRPLPQNNRGDLPDKEKMSEELTAAAQVLALFSVLITTVTFASAFTLPGGYRSAGDAAAAAGVAGTPVLAGPRRSYAFDAFILSDALAFGLSLLATSILLYAGVPGTLNNRFSVINLAYGLMWHSARSLLAAFGLGLFMVLLPVARSIAIAVAYLMILLAVTILKGSEGINSLGIIHMTGIGRSRKPSPQYVVLGYILFVFNHFWSYLLIFGLPAIRKWPSFTLSPY